MENKNIKVVKNILILIKEKQKIEILLIFVILVFSAVLTQLTPLAIGYLTDNVLVKNKIEINLIINILLYILIINIVNESIIVVKRLIIEDISTTIEKNGRKKASEKLLKAPLSYYRMHMTGNIHGRLNRSLEGTTKLIKLLFMDFAPAIATGIASVIIIFTKLPFMLSLFSIMVVPIGLVIVLRQIKTQMGIRVELIDTKADMDGMIVELLGGIETIRTLDSTDDETNRISNYSEKLRLKEMKHHKAMAFYDSLKFLNEIFFSVAIIAITVFLSSKNIISIGVVLVSYLCFTKIISPLRELHRILDELSESLILAKDYISFLEIENDFSYNNNEITSQINEGTENQITFKDVSFSYFENINKKILKNINLSIKEGEFIGIVGPSGCGKSTLIKLLGRLEKCEGNIYLGNDNLDRYSRKEISKEILIIPQAPFLIAGTIKDNICYGLKRNIKLEEVKLAAKKANIDTFIEQLSNKYYFNVSEGGTNLSGGQKQRIALARIFLRKPKILILDEATSALDNITEKNIQYEIEKMKKENSMTIISIAHRLTTLKNCDDIIVMKKGEIVQRGKYNELSFKPGLFKEMVRDSEKMGRDSI